MKTKTLEQLSTDYLSHLQAINFSAVTRRCRVGQLRHFVHWLDVTHGVTAPPELRTPHLAAYQRHLADCTNPRGLPILPGSRNNHVKAVKGFLLFLKERGVVDARLCRQLKYVKESQRLPTSVLPHAEMRERLERLPGNTELSFRNRTILELLYTSGIRRAELLGLKLEDVDLVNAVAKVHGKGDKERVVPIGKTARRWLTNYPRGVRPFWKQARTQRAVFLNQRGEPLGENGLRYIVNVHFEHASVHVTPHTFRRSCTTEMVRAQANLYHVKEMLGHESLDTLRVYTKLTITDLKKTHAKCHPREQDS